MAAGGKGIQNVNLQQFDYSSDGYLDLGPEVKYKFIINSVDATYRTKLRFEDPPANPIHDCLVSFMHASGHQCR
jgi:hypothetical protein